MKKILFITPYFHRSGSELVLYNLISKLDNTKYDVAVAITKAKGELIELLPKHIKKFVYADFIEEKQKDIELKNKQTAYRTYRFLSKAISPSKIFPEEVKANYDSFFESINEQFKPDVWYINTILQPFAVELSKELNIPCIVHSHEMEQMLSFLNEKDLDNLINIPKLIIGCSKPPVKVLQQSGRNKDIEICYPGIDLKQINPDNKSKDELKRKLNIDKSAFIWVMSGMLDINKNPVKFVEICNEINSRGYNAHFIWIGGGSESAYSSYAKKLAIQYGIENKITWTGKLKDEYYNYLNLADGFVLTSTRDSFPLVLIESAYLCKPIVGFNSGGINDFFGDKDTYNICSTNETKDIADVMVNIMTNKLPYDFAAYKSRAEEFDISVQFPKWEEIINND